MVRGTGDRFLRQRSTPTSQSAFTPHILHDKPTASIVNLLIGCRPATISRLIVTVIIDAIDGCTFWSLPHVCDKVLVGTAYTDVPSVTNGDASTTIIGPFRVPFIKATAQHGFPRPVGVRRGLSMCEQPSSGLLFLNTSTTTGQFSECAAGDNGVLAAVADAPPHSFTEAVAPGFLNDSQSAKSLIGKVKLRGHREPPILGVMRTAAPNCASAQLYPQGVSPCPA